MAAKPEDEDYIEIKVNEEPEGSEDKKEEAPAEKTEEKAEPEKKQPKKEAKPKKKQPKKASKGKKASHTKKKGKKSKKRNDNWLWITLLIVGIAVIAAVVYLTLQDDGTGVNQEGGEEDLRVVTMVNGEPIYKQDVEEMYASLPPQLKNQVDEQVILEQLIQQELILQAAEEEGIEATEEDVDAYVEGMLEQYGIPESQLEGLLGQQGLTMEEFRQQTRQQIVLNEYLNQTVYEGIEVTQDDVAARYENNKEAFMRPETATVRHILIATEGQNRTMEEALELAQDVEGMIADDFSNFCALAANYSDDPGSVATCGEYNVTAQSNLVAPFKEAALNMSVDDTLIVETQYGQHLLWKVAQHEAGYRPLEEVEDTIRTTIREERASQMIQEHINALRDNATIERYPLNETEPETAPQTTEEDEEDDEEMQVEIEPTKPAREGGFGECLAEAGATLYGTSWSPDTDTQKELLGDALDEIEYVDCDPATGEAPAACNDIDVYPTWVIDDATLKGKQSVNALERETGCTA
ncbi:peptidylprolyl isomerase [Candidatus Woesearchaeota archaeon]|nr:peptidylprolyl isomerase [Candidatus Woesearchaeota archaeon]